MADINEVASAFTKFYYETFDRNRSELTPLYVSKKEKEKGMWKEMKERKRK